MSMKVQAVVIGGGVIGLSCARSMVLEGIETLIIEKNKQIGMETSSRSSEVIHAGLYYPPNSLKSRLSIEGKNLLYTYLSDNSLPYKRCGKLIVATNTHQISKLFQIKENAELAGINDIEYLDSQQVRESFEASVSCKKALFSPSSGILDTHSFMNHLLKDFCDNHGDIAMDCTVHSVRINASSSSRMEIQTSQGTIHSDYLINAAGLHAIDLARNLSNFPKHFIPKSYFAKGNYFKLNSKPPFTHLVYPIPEVGGLGVHATVDIAGQVRFGPDVQYLRESDESLSFEFSRSVPNDYAVENSRERRFYEEIRKYWPGLPEGSLSPDYSGIRPKLSGPEHKEFVDFMIQGPLEHGIDGLVNLFGIESPGITSSLAIGRYVTKYCLK